MSTIRANTITDTAGTGAPTFSNGIISNGNVGIGTSSPAYTLDVSGSGQQAVRVITTDTSGTNVGRFSAEYTGGGGGVASAIDMRAGNGFASIITTTNTPMIFSINNTEQARIDASGNFKFNSGYGSVATAYGCRAWVNFNGTGTVAIRASGNVTSITDGGTGTYTVNFTTALPDADYALVGNCQGNSSTLNIISQAAGSAGFSTRYATGNTLSDPTFVDVAVFR